MYVVWRLQSVRLLNSTLWNPLRYCPPLALFLCHCPLLRFQRPRLVLSPVHTSDNVAKNGDIVAKNRDTVAETGDNVAKTGNIVFLATMLPDCCRFRRQCRLCGRDYGDNVAGFGDNVAGVDGTLGVVVPNFLKSRWRTAVSTLFDYTSDFCRTSDVLVSSRLWRIESEACAWRSSLIWRCSSSRIAAISANLSSHFCSVCFLHSP